MNNSLNNQPSIKSDPKEKAIASFTLGIISLIAGIISSLPLVIVIVLLGFIYHLELELVVVWIGFCLIFIFPAFVGLILGIIARKSTKKDLAIAGITLSIIALILLLLPLIGLIILFSWTHVVAT